MWHPVYRCRGREVQRFIPRFKDKRFEKLYCDSVLHLNGHGLGAGMLQLSEDLRCSFQKIYAAAFRRFTLQLSEDLRCSFQKIYAALSNTLIAPWYFLRFLLLFLTYVKLLFHTYVSYVFYCYFLRTYFLRILLLFLTYVNRIRKK